MNNIQNIDIDIMNHKCSDYIYAKQYDHNRTVIFTVTENGKPKDISDMYCTFIMKGKTNTQFELLERVGNTFKLIVQSRDTAEFGKIPYQLVITAGEPQIVDGHIVWDPDPSDPDVSHMIIGTVTSAFLIEQCVISDEDAESQQSQSVLDELLAELTIADEKITQALGLTDDIEAWAASANADATRSQSYAVGGTDSRQGEDTDNAKYYYQQSNAIWNKICYSKKIVLPANGWDVSTHTQTVAVTGVIANQDDQLIVVRPAQNSITEYVDCAVMAITQATDALTFKCDTNPVNDLDVYVMLQNLDTRGQTRKSYILVTDSVNDEPDATEINTNDFWVVRNYRGEV